jgi:ABC-2 type transport system permease protein
VSALWATFLRELRAYFVSPLAYVVLFFLLVLDGVVFSLIVTILSDPLQPPGRPFDYFFGGFPFWLIVLFAVPVITMRLLAEERKSGTIEVLMTAPVTETQVVLGKYFAALLFYVCLWLPTLVYVAIIARHADVDPGPVVAGYLGVLGVGALFLAVGVFASSVARNQIVAAVLTFALLVLLFSFGLLANLVTGEVLKKAFAYLDLWQHMDDFAKGLVDTRRLVYYLSGSAFFLFLATRALAANKWR